MSEMRMNCDKRKLIVFIFFIFVTFYNVMFNFDEIKFTALSSVYGIDYFQKKFSDGIEKTVCHFPNLKPFDKTISKFVFEETPVDCTMDLKPYKRLFEIDRNGTLVRVGKDEDFLKRICCYLPFDPKGLKGNKDFKKCLKIKEMYTTVPSNFEFISIYCTSESEGGSMTLKRPKLVDLLYFTPLKPKVESRVDIFEKKRNRTSERDIPRVNVVIFGIDSISHLNFQRTMPLTREYLIKTLSAQYLNGYTKVSDNTFPNLVPFLTSLDVGELSRKCWPTAHSYFDTCPFIWQNFKKAGYRTVYGEDAVWMGIFNYEKKGFKKPPTDYYLNNFMEASAELIGHWTSAAVKLCYGPRLGFSILLDYLKKIAVEMGYNRRYFQFIWATSISHDVLNYPRMIDAETKKTIQFLHKRGYFNNTVFIFMSDHGIRFGDIRKTYQGKVEENMPFLYTVLPPWFKDTYPLAVSNLKRNQEKLTTPFDLHEMLKDLLNLNSIREKEIKRRQFRLNFGDFPRGISLFLSIPNSRTCEHAAIPDSYCVCHVMRQIPVDTPKVEESAQAAVDNLNLILNPFSQCEQYNLSSIISAHSVVDFRGSTIDLLKTKPIEYVLIFKTTPGNAVFEATMLSTTIENITETTWKVAGEMSRVNAYGDESHCVDDYILKKYCFCNQIVDLNTLVE